MKAMETSKLLMRSWEQGDLADLFEYARNPNVGPNAGWEPHADIKASKDILNSFIEKDEVWALVHKESGKVIGSVGLHTDDARNMIGYVLSEDYWGMGFVAEAVRQVLRYAFQELKLDVVSAYHYPHNTRSKRVLEKCGFHYEGTLRKAAKIFDGTVYDSVCYSILKEECEFL